MRVITVCQPYAFAIIYGGKTIENRSWETNYRGNLLIHAGKSKAYLKYAEEVERLMGFKLPQNLVFGGIIGKVQLKSCAARINSKWSVDSYWHWLLADPVPIEEIIYCSGKQRLWDFEIEVNDSQSNINAMTKDANRQY